MFVLRMLLMLVVTSGRYGTSPVKLRNILGEDSLRVRDDESAMWNDPYFDRIFELGNLVEHHGTPEIKETGADDESLEDKSEEKNAEQDESENEETSVAAKPEEPRKDEEEVNEEDLETERPAELRDNDVSGEGSDDKTSGGNVRGFVYFTGIVAGSCFVFLVA